MFPIFSNVPPFFGCWLPAKGTGTSARSEHAGLPGSVLALKPGSVKPLLIDDVLWPCTIQSTENYHILGNPIIYCIYIYIAIYIYIGMIVYDHPILPSSDLIINATNSGGSWTFNFMIRDPIPKTGSFHEGWNIKQQHVAVVVVVAVVAVAVVVVADVH